MSSDVRRDGPQGTQLLGQLVNGYRSARKAITRYEFGQFRATTDRLDVAVRRAFLPLPCRRPEDGHQAGPRVEILAKDKSSPPRCMWSSRRPYGR